MTLRLRPFVGMAIVGASLAAIGAFEAGLPRAGGTLRAQGDAVRPDVIIVLTDQQRADAFGAAGAADLHTPVMDRLARQGVVFTRAFTATPQCSPSRAALLTGRYPHRTGVRGNTAGGAGGGRAAGPPAGMSGALDPSLPTLGRVFAAAGYETAYFGKWHLGGTPGEYGFESHDSTLGDATLAGHVVAFVQKRAANRVRRPLLLVVSWLNPHDIYDVLTAAPPDARALVTARLPSNMIDDLRHKPFPQRHYLEEDQGKPFAGADREVWRRYRAFYNRLVETVDRQIGTVLDALEPNEVSPITVFSTDHGDLGGAHGLPYKGPAMYEELVRVPLVISWPGRIRPARSDALVSLIDLFPTLCDLTGVASPDGVDGVSLRPVLEQRAAQVLEWRAPLPPATLLARGGPAPRSAPRPRDMVVGETHRRVNLSDEPVISNHVVLVALGRVESPPEADAAFVGFPGEERRQRLQVFLVPERRRWDGYSLVERRARQKAGYSDTVHGRRDHPRSPAAQHGCETCHGPGSTHVDDPEVAGLIRAFTKEPPRDANQTCLTCHSRGTHAMWEGSTHDSRNLSCVTCHSVHAFKSETSQLKTVREMDTCATCHRDKVAKVDRSGHMPLREGKMECSTCHNPHGSTNVKQLRKGDSIAEACTSCHADKRGPFLWEHAPTRDGCTTCHDPHGSSNERMLVTKPPILCQRCHIATRHPSTIYDGALIGSAPTPSVRIYARSCVTCHSNIHGSNHPSGQRFIR